MLLRVKPENSIYDLRCSPLYPRINVQAGGGLGVVTQTVKARRVASGCSLICAFGRTTTGVHAAAELRGNTRSRSLWAD